MKPTADETADIHAGLIELMSQGPITSVEAAELIGKVAPRLAPVTTQKSTRHLATLVQAGRATKVDFTHWGLTPSTTSQPESVTFGPTEPLFRATFTAEGVQLSYGDFAVIMAFLDGASHA